MLATHMRWSELSALSGVTSSMALLRVIRTAKRSSVKCTRLKCLSSKSYICAVYLPPISTVYVNFSEYSTSLAKIHYVFVKSPFKEISLLTSTFRCHLFSLTKMVNTILFAVQRLVQIFDHHGNTSKVLYIFSIHRIRKCFFFYLRMFLYHFQGITLRKQDAKIDICKFYFKNCIRNK